MKKPALFALLFLFALVGCRPMRPSTKDPGFNTVIKRVFVRIVTTEKSYDTMVDAMASMKGQFLERGVEMSGGIIPENRYDTESAAVAAKLQNFKPEVVLDLASLDPTLRWAPIDKIEYDPELADKGRYYMGVLFTAADKRPVWSLGIWRYIDLGGLASAHIAETLVGQLSQDGIIPPRPPRKRK